MNAKIMKDPRLAVVRELKNLSFDGQRILYR